MWAILIIYPPDIFQGGQTGWYRILCGISVAKHFSKKNRYIFQEETIEDLKHKTFIN